MSKERDQDIERTLEDIFKYIGSNNKEYSTWAALQGMLERLIDRNTQPPRCKFKKRLYNGSRPSSKRLH